MLGVVALWVRVRIEVWAGRKLLRLLFVVFEGVAGVGAVGSRLQGQGFRLRGTGWERIRDTV